MTKRNPKDTNVAVLMGGWSAEREVSLSSGEGCAAALRRAGFKVTPIDVQRETIFSVLQDLSPMWRSMRCTENGARMAALCGTAGNAANSLHAFWCSGLGAGDAQGEIEAFVP